MSSHPLEPLLQLDGVRQSVDGARRACEELRWHRALRRQWAVVRAESGIRAAHAGMILDGLRLPLAMVRDVARGATSAPAGPDGDAVLAALRVQADVERLMAPPGAPGGTGPVPFGQLLVRLHVAAAAGPGERTGRPRDLQQPDDLRGLGPAPTGGELAARLSALADLVARPLPPQVPALVLAGVVHGELLALRPFGEGNGAVARGVVRHLLTARGVDPVGVVVPEIHGAREPNVYLSTAAGFLVGTSDGVAAWLRYCASAVTTGAVEGRTVAEAVLAGRLGADGAREDGAVVEAGVAHGNGAP